MYNSSQTQQKRTFKMALKSSKCSCKAIFDQFSVFRELRASNHSIRLRILKRQSIQNGNRVTPEASNHSIRLRILKRIYMMFQPTTE